MASLDLPTIRSAIWSGQVRTTHNHVADRPDQSCRDRRRRAVHRFRFAPSDATERQAYIKSLDFELILGNGSVYPQKGKFYALDRNLDTKTGSIRYYVTFPNPGNILRPGQFGKRAVRRRHEKRRRWLFRRKR